MKNSFRSIYKRKKTKGEGMVDAVIIILLIIVGFISIFPIWYVLVASVSDPFAIASGKVILWPVGFNLEGYEKLLNTKKVWIGYRNSILYTSLGTIVNLLVQLPCGYALTRRSLPFRKFFNLFFIITMYFSGGMVPSYILNAKLGFVDNPLVMIIPGCVSVYNLILIQNFLSTNMPESLFDAARIDGASYMCFFKNIVLPLSVPVVAIIALLSMQSHWNAYLNAQMYLYSSEYHTLQQVIVQITATIDTSLMDTSQISAEELVKQILEKQLLKYSVVVVAALPMVIIYPFIQKFFIKGIMLGAVKG